MSRYTVKMRARFEDAVAVITAALEQHGFRVIRSFDLTSALDPDDPACSCQYHGTEHCTCHYTILLVYSASGGAAHSDTCPCTITVHTQDAETFVTVTPLDSPPSGSEPDFVQPDHALIQGLVEAFLGIPSDRFSEAHA